MSEQNTHADRIKTLKSKISDLVEELKNTDVPSKVLGFGYLLRDKTQTLIDYVEEETAKHYLVIETRDVTPMSSVKHYYIFDKALQYDSACSYAEWRWNVSLDDTDKIKLVELSQYEFNIWYDLITYERMRSSLYHEIFKKNESRDTLSEDLNTCITQLRDELGIDHFVLVEMIQYADAIYF